MATQPPPTRQAPVLPPPPIPAQTHAVTAVPTRPPDNLAVPQEPQSAFALVAITIPAVLAAAATFINHTAGRRR
ncbi:hypothetical protein ACFZB9_27505 [Kitasatospora sp. NPDC008050]|uniref:hypothetical protein n=1 Tax=Kitasatospora sp. NPDC008050 TaxID=3364021 RepID=UPI0036F0E2F4